ncbi:MAG TPA: hypothetical protein PKM65_02250 [Spirochaetota bacterium]|nr:hypothetical protein [Spirochaetota bacterium]HNT12673.1 hypothetical protein [Spirochaetota bacterium]
MNMRLAIAVTISLALLCAMPGAATGETGRGAYDAGKVKLDAGDFSGAADDFARACQLEPGNRTFLLWHMRLQVFLGQNAAFSGDHRQAITLFSQAMAAKEKLTTAKDSEYLAIRRLLDLTREHQSLGSIKPEYVHRVKVLYIRHTDLQGVVDKDGRPVTGKGSMSDSQITASIRAQDQLRFFIEALTRGKLSLSFDRTVVDATLTKAVIYARQANTTMYRPDFSSTSESLGPYLFPKRNNIDSIFMYFINPGFSVWPFANAVPLIYVPYTWYGPERGSIALPMDAAVAKNNTELVTNFPHSWVTFHEFFHVIERRSGGIGPMHGWLPESIEKSKKAYPDWVPDANATWTATEYTWYRYHLLNTLPARMQMQSQKSGITPPFANFSFSLTSPDGHNDAIFKTYTRALAKISLENLRLAEELVAQADKARRSKRTEEARALYTKALNHNQYHHRALYELGMDAHRRRDSAEAERYFSILERVFPDPKYARPTSSPTR